MNCANCCLYTRFMNWPFELQTNCSVNCTFIRIVISCNIILMAKAVKIKLLCTSKMNNSIRCVYLQVRYTSYRDRPHEERQNRFQMGCREGHVDIVRIKSIVNSARRVTFFFIFSIFYSRFTIKQAFATTGTNLQLMFTPNMPSMTSYHQPTIGYCDFEKEQGMVRTYI